LNTPFAEQRDLENARQYIETRIIRFDTGSSKLVPGEADRIDDVAAEMKRLPGARITITGHADETGSPDTNSKLSLDRANRVGDALVAHGILPAALTITGTGNAQPLRQGSTDWDRQVNRSVSFTVSAISVTGK
jgi:outer membrane protein OmpA-like peptidoglycan-associated protein